MAGETAAKPAAPSAAYGHYRGWVARDRGLGLRPEIGWVSPRDRPLAGEENQDVPAGPEPEEKFKHQGNVLI
jgi:hypothetical protein